jgi:hypothetical protein
MRPAKESAFPQRSEGGLAASDVFYRDFNDYSFYVEDSEQENLYFDILKKLFPNVSLEKIFPLGGKPNVLAHSKDEANQLISNRIYLLDKDFDDLLGTKEDIAGVFYLDEFCIENYLLDEEAIVEVVLETHPKEKRDDIRKHLSLATIIPAIAGDLKPLFALFFLAQTEGLKIANCGTKPEKFCNKKQLWRTCPTLVGAYSSEISSRCKASSCEQPAAALSTDPRLHHFFATADGKVISGKFWLAMLFHYVKSRYKLGSISFESFVFRTAKSCSFVGLRALADEIGQVCMAENSPPVVPSAR